MHRLGAPPSPFPIPGGRGTVGRSRLSDTELADLSRQAGPSGVVQWDAASRRAASVGGSYADLQHLRIGELTDVVDAVVIPSSRAEVEALVGWADRERIALVPRGGGTSVVGGLDPLRGDCQGVVSVSLDRLQRAGPIDSVRGRAQFEAGIFGPDLEAFLAQQGWTLGHFPQSFERSSLGGWILTHSFGQSSTRYGTPVDRLEGFEIVTPAGTFQWERSASGTPTPDPGTTVPGSEGILGIQVSATVRVDRRPALSRYFAALLPNWEAGVDVTHRLAVSEPIPAVLRLSDAPETELSLAESGWEAGGRREWLRRITARCLRYRAAPGEGSCLLIGSAEGSRGEVAQVSDTVRSTVRAARGAVLPGAVGRSWERGRFRTPYLRDDLVDLGWFVETFETFAPWARAAVVAKAARTAVEAWAARQGVHAFLGTHLSHPNGAGTALYFTTIAPQPGDRIDPMVQDFVRSTASAVVDAGGTVTHHHGIGTYHRPWVRASYPAEWLDSLRALKARWDPHGIMNPGKTLPEE